MNTTLTLSALAGTLLVTFVAAEPAPAPQSPTDFQITLGGEVGVAAEANMARFRSSPFDSVPWLRADVTGEKAAEFNKIVEGGMPFRPFKEYSGDISGRFIEIIAMNAQGSAGTNPAFLELLKEVPKHQRAGGYFCASGEINWQQPIDRNSNGESSVMMPALWGNARILCGLVEACRAFPDNKEILATAIKLGDFYAGVVPRFTDSARMTVKKGYCTAQKPVTGVTFVYAGCVYAEGRRCNRLPKGPVDGQPFALGFGPKLFAAANQSLTLPAWPTTVEVLKTQGVELMSSALRGKDYRFVFDR